MLTVAVLCRTRPLLPPACPVDARASPPRCLKVSLSKFDWDGAESPVIPEFSAQRVSSTASSRKDAEGRMGPGPKHHDGRPKPSSSMLQAPCSLLVAASNAASHHSFTYPYEYATCPPRTAVVGLGTPDDGDDPKETREKEIGERGSRLIVDSRLRREWYRGCPWGLQQGPATTPLTPGFLMIAPQAP